MFSTANKVCKAKDSKKIDVRKGGKEFVDI